MNFSNFFRLKEGARRIADQYQVKVEECKKYFEQLADEEASKVDAERREMKEELRKLKEEKEEVRTYTLPLVC